MLCVSHTDTHTHTLLSLSLSLSLSLRQRANYRRRYPAFCGRDMYKKCHAAIRKDPAPKAKVTKNVTKKRWNAAKIGLAARKAKVAKTKEEFLAQIEDMK